MQTKELGIEARATAELVLQDSATREDMGMLAVLEALAAQEQVTQRELSRRTGSTR